MTTIEITQKPLVYPRRYPRNHYILYTIKYKWFGICFVEYTTHSWNAAKRIKNELLTKNLIDI